MQIDLRYVNIMTNHELNKFVYIDGEYLEYVVDDLEGGDAFMSAKFDKGELVDVKYEGLISTVDIDEFNAYISEVQRVYEYYLYCNQHKKANDNRYEG